MQVCSLAGIIAGIWVASRYGAEVGAWLKLDETISAAGGFVVVLLAVVLLVAIAGRLVRKLCHFAGFGIADIVLGIAVSVLKYMLLLSVLFSAFDTLNEDYTLIGPVRSRNQKVTNPSCASPSVFSRSWNGRRTGAATSTGAGRRIGPMGKRFTGVVIRATGSWYEVLHDGEAVRCRIRGRCV